MELLITLLIYIIVFALIYYLVITIIGMLPVPAQIQQFVKVICLVIFLILIVSLFFGWQPLPRFHFK